ncbi:MTSS1-like protein isoform X1 [Trichogramma pretiosum]|uniref:MTSS1-like protein isoform X1 n=1 Tax=Trichogramma pretiosum TaxID=7493 RepID=UPI0006C972F8|nr:MTSS1-like protein isoform X1 [Trichogramma pretiosum]XP_023318827.1 MTSS1-like protein isoform X1 [Trichogramma pretiosum]
MLAAAAGATIRASSAAAAATTTIASSNTATSVAAAAAAAALAAAAAPSSSTATTTSTSTSAILGAALLDPVNMDATIERECSALGCLFQQIIQDMKNGAPLWEDLISKATKLHSCLKTAIVAISAYLEAFQKIADAATNARGATREIGTALTRICLRHKAVETRVKSFTCAIMDCLVVPLQEKLEDWKKSLVYLDKEHAKEYKKARSELKKKSSDTLRLQKKNKARKGLQPQQIYGTLPHGIGHANSGGGGASAAAAHLYHGTNANANNANDPEYGRLLESSAAGVQEKRQTLEETERKAVRMALLEERGRFCQFAKCLKPVLDEEIAMLMEMTHLQEVADQLEKHTASPQQLPPASEQVIIDLKGRDSSQWSMATPPSSPSLSLGSRKSSVCSISSLTSSSSGSCKSHPSPSAGHPSSAWHRSTAQQSLRTTAMLNHKKENRRSLDDINPFSDRLDLDSRSSRASIFSSQRNMTMKTLTNLPDTKAKLLEELRGITRKMKPANGMVTLRYHRAINSGSRDSGFTSLQDTYLQPTYKKQISCPLPQSDNRSSTSTTWSDVQADCVNVQNLGDDPNAANERPHTISTAYEKGHQRPALSAYTFQSPEQSNSSSQPASPVSGSGTANALPQNAGKLQPQQQRKNSSGSIGRERPPIPNRCSSLERPAVPARIDSMPDSSSATTAAAPTTTTTTATAAATATLLQRPTIASGFVNTDSPIKSRAKLPIPAGIPAHLAREIASHQPHLFQQPMYVNMHELASLAASRAQEMHTPPVAAAAGAAAANDASNNAINVTESNRIYGTTTRNISSLATVPNENINNNNEQRSLGIGGVTQRRNSLQQQSTGNNSRPSPPTRRVSAGVVENHDDRPLQHHGDDLDNLPPPPAFLLEGSSPPNATGSPAMQRR